MAVSRVELFALLGLITFSPIGVVFLARATRCGLSLSLGLQEFEPKWVKSPAIASDNVTLQHLVDSE